MSTISNRRQRLIDGEIPFRVARDLATSSANNKIVAIAAALYEVLPDSAAATIDSGWRLAGRLDGVSRHPKYGRKQVHK